MNIIDIQNKIIADFSLFEDVQDKYRYLLELGEELDEIPDAYKVPQNLIKGCQSKVWLYAQMNDDGRIIYFGDADSVFVKGLVYLALSIFSNKTPKEILDTECFFIDKVALSSFISPTRSNGFVALIKQIKLYALALNNDN